MGFLHKLWDETLAGPMPENGLGKLRKYNSFGGGTSRSLTVETAAEDVPISRSIIIVRSISTNDRPATSDPTSHSAPITPRAPLSPATPTGDFKKFTRKKS